MRKNTCPERLICLLLLLVGCARPETGSVRPPASVRATAADSALLDEARLHFRALTVPAPESVQVELGRQLFFDPRLSRSGKISCSTCHDLSRHGVDGLTVPVGHNGQPGRRNTPTVLNAFLNRSQFWDGRAPDLASQAVHPILDPREMAMPDQQTVVAKLQQIPGYRSAFARAFPTEATPLNFPNLTRALAAFEQTLATPGRFDQFLAGRVEQLNASEKEGLRLFLNKGCVACHDGPGLGGNSLYKSGVLEPYPSTADRGRFEVTQRERDRFVFKVPVLRNVARTAPYFHDGRVRELREAIDLMAKIQIGTENTPSESEALLAFLKSLDGQLPPTAPPVLPQ
jgi:cytochrome c peroxidase